MSFINAARLEKLPPYLFIEIDRKKKEAIDRGVDIISLGVGDPDLPTPPFIVEALYKAAQDKANHQYPFGSGLLKYREAIARWFLSRFSVKLDPKDQIAAIIGSKEAIGHFPLGILNPGDVCLMPSPGYPVYHAGTLFAGGESYFLPLLEENNFLPDLDAVPAEVLKKSKLLWINSPQNPTTTVADRAFFEKVVAFAKKNNIIVANDAAYSEIYYDGKKPMSLLEVPGAMDVCIEFHSLSKTFNMTGWRIGFAVGNRDLVKVLTTVKENYDSGVFNAIQYAAIAGLEAPPKVTDDIRAIYQDRRDYFAAGLRELGWKFKMPEAAFYFWVKVPNGMSSAEWCGKLLDEAGVIVTPGNGMGKAGEGYFRMTVTVEKERLKEALERFSKIK
jgi:LL-diaminopimelate aminotransferase